LKLELSIAPDHPGRGMTGSGMLVANPPYTLAESFAEVLPWLMDTLAPAQGAGTLRWLRPAP
jgi:23S rRNA (adenine2030-N6)-methyltransferase